MASTKTHRVGIIMNGVTGRMGTNQHLIRSILAIIKQGGVRIGDDVAIIPEPMLVGRNAAKLQKLCSSTGVAKWTTDLDSALSDPHYTVYFDSQTTNLRVQGVCKAIEAGKHIYCEKPTAGTTEEAYGLYRRAKQAGIKHGVVQDKLWLPGLLKLRTVAQTGFFGKIISVRGEFGYWVFEGEAVPAQRPSWNYRKEEGGGIILDMFAHWRYVLDNLFAPVKSVSCVGAIHVGRRWDEQGKPYDVNAEDSAYATFELGDGIIAHFNSSWAVRVRRDDLLTVQVDGTKGSAVAGLRQCWTQSYAATPRPVWNPDSENPINFQAAWSPVPEYQVYDNAFKAQWELFLKHLVTDEPFPWDLREGAKGVQLAEKAMESWRKRCWVDVEELAV